LLNELATGAGPFAVVAAARPRPARSSAACGAAPRTARAPRFDPGATSSSPDSSGRRSETRAALELGQPQVLPPASSARGLLASSTRARFAFHLGELQRPIVSTNLGENRPRVRSHARLGDESRRSLGAFASVCPASARGACRRPYGCDHAERRVPPVVRTQTGSSNIAGLRRRRTWASVHEVGHSLQAVVRNTCRARSGWRPRR